MKLEQRLREAARRSQAKAVDWEAKKLVWVSAVGDLYSSIEDWLTYLVNKGLVRTQRLPIEVTEEYIGTYQIDSLQIAFGDRIALLEPVGANIIGAYGRIDFYPQGDKTKMYMLVLVEEKEGSKAWRISNAWQRQQTAPFTKDVLEATLDEWLEK